MPADVYVTRDDVEDFWSQYGVDLRLDDDFDGEANSTEEERLDRIRTRASVFVGSILSRRFSPSTIAGASPPTSTPESVKWFTLVVACYMLARRRDNPVSADLAEDYRFATEWMKSVADGTGYLIDVSDNLDHRPFVSNFRVDGSYVNSKIRVVESLSTGGRPTKARRFSAVSFYYPYD